jgi:hypothetical protein
MWPWAHAAVGYLLYAAYRRLRASETPTGPAVILLGLGTQLPDLVDKPLAWYLDVLPYGRSFAHSLVTGVPLVMLPIALLLYRRGQRGLAVAFSIGYLSHLAGDGYVAVLRGEFVDLHYLGWPLLSLPQAETEVEGLLTHLRDIEGSPVFVFGLLLTVLALGLWIRHGVPGLLTLRDWARGESASN